MLRFHLLLVGEHRPLGGRSAAGVVLEEGSASTSTSAVKRGKRETGSRQHPLRWPEALRKVRTWLEPYVMLMRYWKAYSNRPPPKELRRLLEWVFVGKGLYLYVH
jgi:hypothetical protein